MKPSESVVRKHSKFSASGAERWMNCPGSVELSEGQPDRPSPWAGEGTRAHGVLESMLECAIINKSMTVPPKYAMQFRSLVPKEMFQHGLDTANFLLSVAYDLESQLIVESRVTLEFIHPEAFGTLDSSIIEHFGTLHIFDYKYGAGHSVSPNRNLQLIFYALGMAYKYQWNFKRVKLWIIQPRAKGYDGPVFWEMNIQELKDYVPVFRDAINRVELNPKKYVEGPWCHWCKGKLVCPLKKESKLSETAEVFQPIGESNDETSEEHDCEKEKVKKAKQNHNERKKHHKEKKTEKRKKERDRGVSGQSFSRGGNEFYWGVQDDEDFY